MPALAVLAVLAALVASGVEAQGSSYRPLRVRSCAYADSLLGPLRDDYRSEVLGFHHKERDSTYLIAGSQGNRPRVHVSIKLPGQRPTREPVAQLAVYLRGDDAKAMVANNGPPVVMVVLDDSINVEPAATDVGTFVGPKNAPVTIPVSALLLTEDLLNIARGRTISVRAGAVSVPFSQAERQALRAILRVATCAA